jgi:hypothetical protein
MSMYVNTQVFKHSVISSNMTLSDISLRSQPVPLATVDEMRERIRRKSRVKGRQADAASLKEVRTLIGAVPHRRDLGSPRFQCNK